MKKHRVLFLTYGKLPIPAVKGGAIETLIDSLIEENEQRQELELIVVSSADSAIPSFNQTHQFSQVISVQTKERPIWWFYQKCWNKATHIVTGKRTNLIPYPELMNTAKCYLEENPVDCLIDLNCPERIPVVRSFFSGKLGVYLHNDYLNPQTMGANKLLDHLDGVFSVCDFLNDRVREIEYPDDWPAFYRVNNGISLEAYLPATPEEKQEIRAQWKYTESDCVIVFSGRVTETKGLHLLFEALNRLDSLENVKVLVLGGTTYSSAKTDRYFEKVISQAEQLPIDVRFTGYIEKQQIPHYLKAADICAVPSIFHETCCLSAVEAQAMGIPVIATRIGGIPEYIGEKSARLIEYDAQFLENFAEALDQLIHDEKLRQQLSEEALNKRTRHSKERYYNEFVKSIKQFVEKDRKKETEDETINFN